MTAELSNLASEVSLVVNKYIDNGKLTTEEVCGVLDVVSFRVKQVSYIPAEAESGGGSPVSILQEGPSSSASPSEKYTGET